MKSSTGSYAVRGLRLAYHTWGDPSLPPVVLLHGLQDHGRSYARVARALGGGLFLVAPDLRGHGESEWVGNGSDYDFYDYVGDAVHLVAHLGLQRYALVGHSLGGGVATALAAIESGRVSKLVLLEGMGPAAQDLSDTVARLKRWTSALRRPGMDHDVEARRRVRPRMASLEEACERLRRTNPRLAPDVTRELAETFTEFAAPGSAELVWRFDPLHRAPTVRPYLFDEAAALWRALDMPVLSLLGSESVWVPPDLVRRHACIASLRVGIVEGAGHNIHHDRPDVVARAIQMWIRGTEGALPTGIREGSP